MYKTYPQAVSNIKAIIKANNLTLLSKEPEDFVKKQLRFFWAICENKKHEKVFFKSLLKKERNIKQNFLNEITFLQVMQSHPKHNLHNLSAKLLFAKKGAGIAYLCYGLYRAKQKQEAMFLQQGN